MDEIRGLEYYISGYVRVFRVLRAERKRDDAIIAGPAIALTLRLVPAEVALCVAMVQLNRQILLNILDSKMISFEYY